MMHNSGLDLVRLKTVYSATFKLIKFEWPELLIYFRKYDRFNDDFSYEDHIV